MAGELDTRIASMYRDHGLSTMQIARQVGWSDSFVRSRLVALGAQRRSPWAAHAVRCDTAAFVRLYVEGGLSLEVIGDQFGCSGTTVRRRLVAAGVACREGAPDPKYPRLDFSGDPCEMAYLIGFRIGDLNVELHCRTVLVKCTSTQREQIDLFRALFQRYGHVYTDEATRARRTRQAIGMSVALNRSFDFLLPKDDCVPDWVLGADEPFFAFLAGYIDAEAYIQTRLPRNYATLQVRLEVRSYERGLLQQAGERPNELGIPCPPARSRVAAGYTNGRGTPSNGTSWGLGLSAKRSLHLLFVRIDPYIKHEGRRRDMLRAWAAIDYEYR
jgi:hypothetical protein